ncbi:Cna B-type domain-containing protein, partial [Candidatus Saccharibacteria bacterium]|nr:Cna B-type domain-containing protein [Candidatus Saccharibacteria bacterium]
TVSNDNSIYKVWEEAATGQENMLDNYTSSATSTSPVTVASGSATITNTMKMQDIVITKVWDDDSNIASTRPSNITVHLAKLNIQSVNNNDPSSGLNNTVFDANSFTDLATSGTWTDNGNDTWSYTFSIKASEDITKLYIYEDNISGYTSDATATNPKTIPASKAVTITNTVDRFDVSLKKQVTGNLGVTSDTFNFNIKLFDQNGTDLTGNFSATKNGVNYTATFGANGYSGTFTHDDTITIHGLLTGYSYTITEADTKYSESYKITAADGTVIVSTTPGLSASRSITDKSQIVTFSNNLENTITGTSINIWPYLIMLLIITGFFGGHHLMLTRHYSQRINNQTYISLN